jgi:hypothetical protein
MIEIKITAMNGDELREHIAGLTGMFASTTPLKYETLEQAINAKQEARDLVDFPILSKPEVKDLDEALISAIDNLECDVDDEAFPKTVEEALTVVPEKAKRKPKLKAVEAEPILPVLEQVNIPMPPVIPAAPPIQQPAHFYSESEFIANLPKVMNQLLVDKVVNQEWISNKAKELEVSFIFTVASDKVKVMKLYNDLIAEGKITKKSNY